LVAEWKREWKSPRPLSVATTGYARLIAAKLTEISWSEPNLTLKGLRLVWTASNAAR
jgi:pantothenate kinase type III